jgi:hypothetical protein
MACKPRFETRRRLRRARPTLTNDLGQKVKIIRPFSWKYRTEDYGPEADEYVVKCPLYGLKCAKGERKSLGSATILSKWI